MSQKNMKNMKVLNDILYYKLVDVKHLYLF